MKKLRNLKTKLFIVLLVMRLLPFAVIGLISIVISNRSLSSVAFSQLEGIREIKKARMESFFNERKANMDILAETTAVMTQQAFEKFGMVQSIKKARLQNYLERCVLDISVISKNAIVGKALGAFASLIDADGKFDADMYDFTEDFNFGNSLKQFKEEYGYYDFLIISKEGRVVYSLNREPDLGADIASFKDSAIQRCFSAGIEKINIQDFEPTRLPEAGKLGLSVLP